MFNEIGLDYIGSPTAYMIASHHVGIIGTNTTSRIGIILRVKGFGWP